jgi:Uma2 family endonuclease
MLAIEVISESNSAAQMQRKVRKYFDAGSTEVWLVYPATLSIWVHRKGHALEFRDKLESEIVPGVTIDISALFAGLL